MNKILFGLQWHITDKCDQRCKHCYIFEGKDEKQLLELDLFTLEKILKNPLICGTINRQMILIQRSDS